MVDGHYDEDVHWFSSNDWHLGGGANGRCYIGTDHRTGVNFAIKRVIKCDADRMLSCC